MTDKNLHVFKNHDQSKAIQFFKTEIEKDPNYSFLYKQLAISYDEILNDDINFIKYAKKAYEIDSLNSSNTISFTQALIEGEKFNEAKIIMESDNFKSVITKKQELEILFLYYYHQRNYKKSQEVLVDSLMANSFYYKAINYAQLRDRKSIDSLFKNYNLLNSHKAFVFAILKEKDSMYHYLEINTRPNDMNGPNSRKEFDPYRKEERFKALLRRHLLPITHWNE